MYTVTVPIMRFGVNKQNRADFLTLLKRAEADRLLIATDDTEDSQISEEALAELKENIAYFKENGLSVAVWLGMTIGHGGTLLNSQDRGEGSRFQRLVDLAGRDLYDTHCPFDKAFQSHIGRSIARYADIGADFLLLDDDFRLSQHGGEYCCACDLHMAKIRAYCGEEISRADLKRLAFGGQKNKYRDAWLRAQGESLKELAQAIRRAVDQVNPDCPLAVCSAYCSWDLDGADPIEITDILAGKNKKILRLHGAPYWSALNSKPIEGVCEMERMFASFLKDRPDIEIISEGDAYPRPRTNVPASLLEIMDGALRADGSFDGMLKYMINYNDRPLSEQGYINRHAADLGKLRGFEHIFPKGANAGVRVLIKPHLFEDADLSLSHIHQQSPYPHAGNIFSICGIPTVYKGEGICCALFGENARHFDPSYYEKGAILDAVAAKILTDRGVDVGLAHFGETLETNFGTVTDTATGDCSTVWKASANFLCGDFKESIRPILTVNAGGKQLPMAYCYENAAGQRFLVFTFLSDDLPAYPAYFRSYEVQAALRREIPWVADQALPAILNQEVEVYTLCEKGDGYTSVALFNCYADAVLHPVITLDKTYSKLECVGCEGHIEGNLIILDSQIPAFDFAAFKAFD